VRYEYENPVTRNFCHRKQFAHSTIVNLSTITRYSTMVVT